MPAPQLMVLFAALAILTSPWVPTTPPVMLLLHALRLDKYSMVPHADVMMDTSIMELLVLHAPAIACHALMPALAPVAPQPIMSTVEPVPPVLLTASPAPQHQSAQSVIVDTHSIVPIYASTVHPPLSLVLQWADRVLFAPVDAPLVHQLPLAPSANLDMLFKAVLVCLAIRLVKLVHQPVPQLAFLATQESVSQQEPVSNALIPTVWTALRTTNIVSSANLVTLQSVESAQLALEIV